MLSKGFNLNFSEIYESLQKMNECGGANYGGYFSCGNWYPYTEEDWERNQRWEKEREESKAAIQSAFDKIPKTDPNYRYYQQALRYNAYHHITDEESADEYLKRVALEYKKEADADARRELLANNRRKYLANRGITPEMEKAKKDAMRYQNEANNLRQEADFLDKKAEEAWERAGGRDIWNFKLPRANKDGEYIDA